MSAIRDAVCRRSLRDGGAGDICCHAASSSRPEQRLPGAAPSARVRPPFNCVGLFGSPLFELSGSARARVAFSPRAAAST
jgi:hypothetical protein